MRDRVSPIALRGSQEESSTGPRFLKRKVFLHEMPWWETYKLRGFASVPIVPWPDFPPMDS